MRWILVTFAVCVAVATANLYEEDDDNYDEQNKIDIFLPRSLGNMDKTVRSFFYNYWLYPAMIFKTRVPYGEMSPYLDYNYVEPLTFQDVFEKPVVVVTPSQTTPNTFSTFYLHNGLRTLHRYQAFSWLQEFLKHPGLKGLIFYPHLIYNTRFFETPITGVTFQEDMRMSELVSIENCNSGRIPYMFVAPEEVFDRMHFDNIAKVSDFKVYNDAIEVHPIVPEPRPMYEPFYGPQSSQTAQQRPSPPPTPPPAPPQSNESASFRTGYEGSIEQPEVLAPSVSLVASQAGRGVYGGMGYGSGEQYGYGQNLIAKSGNVVASQFGRGEYGVMGYAPGEQYGYDQNQAVSEQYNINYGQSGFGQPEGYRRLNVAQEPYSSYQQGGSKFETHVDAVHGASSKDVYGTLRGNMDSMPAPEARFEVAQNSAQFQAGGQVQYGTSKGSAYMNSRAEAVNAQGGQAGISRVAEGAFSGQLAGFDGAKLTGGHALKVAVQNTENVLRTDSASTQGHKFSATHEGASVAGGSGEQSVAGSVSRVESGSTAEVESLLRASSGFQPSDKSAIVYPKEDGVESPVGAQFQGGVASGGQVESVSRTGVQSGEHSTESQVSGHYEVHSSGGSVQSGNLAKTESAKFEGQAGVQGGIAAGINAGGFSRTGGSENVMGSQTFTFSSTVPTLKLIRTEGNVGSSIGLQGGTGGNIGLGGKFGFSENIGGGLLRLGSGVVKTFEGTTRGLGAELMQQYEGQVEHSQQSSSVSSSSSVSRSVGSTQSSSSVGSDSVSVSTPLISTARSIVSGGRSIMEASTPSLEPVVVIGEM